eukprot:s110_g24.t1
MHQTATRRAFVVDANFHRAKSAVSSASGTVRTAGARVIPSRRAAISPANRATGRAAKDEGRDWEMNRSAVAEMLQVSPADVQVTVVNETSSQTRRLSVRLKLEVEVVSSAGSVAMLSSELGKEMLHTELLETWDEKGLPLEDFSVLVSSVETETEVETTQAPSESAVEQPPAVSNLVVLVIVLCTLLCSAIAGALYCWRWQRTGATVVPQSPKLHPPTSPCPQPQGGGAESLKSPKGGASPAAVSAMRHAASQSDASSKPTLPVEARKVVPEPRTSNAGSEPMTEAVGMTEEANEIKERVRATSLQVRVVQPGEKPSARAVRVTNATVTRSSTAVSSSSRSPLSHAPRPSDGAIDTGTLTQRYPEFHWFIIIIPTQIDKQVRTPSPSLGTHGSMKALRIVERGSGSATMQNV